MEFDEQFLQEMGLASMPEDQKQRFLAYVQEEVEIRIGEQISRGVPEEKLREFDSLTTPEEAARWLEENRPDYREIVARTIESMKAEIRANRSKLLGTAVAEPQPQPEPAPAPADVPGLALDPNEAAGAQDTIAPAVPDYGAQPLANTPEPSANPADAMTDSTPAPDPGWV